MKIAFMGGAQTVTGSQHLLTVNGKRILLECGLFQGRRQETYEKNKNFLYDPASVDAVLLTHAHIDHSGNIPNLVKSGFQGPIYATGATVDLCEVLLRDSAKLQENDVYHVNKRRKAKGEPLQEPLYTERDVERALPLFSGVNYDERFQVVPGVMATFQDAGHILGSAGILLELSENGQNLRFGITGDIGRTEMPIIKDPNRLRDLQIMLIECTYGGRIHKESDDVMEELAETIRTTINRGGRILIPAFAVGRTQLLVYMLHKLFMQNRIPDIPIFVDSPMAFEATQIFRRHPECFDREMYRTFLQDDRDPFGFGKLVYVRSTDESKKLNDLKEPHIVLAASGMAEGGRVLHHLIHTIGNPDNVLLFVGYAAKHTLSRKLMDGQKTVPIFGEDFPVNCTIKSMQDFSGHADQNGLLDYAQYSPPEKCDKVFLIHGEFEGAEALAAKLAERGYHNIHFPEPGEEHSL